MSSPRAKLVFVMVLLAGPAAVQAEARPRLVVMTDIDGDPDDQQSMVRFLLYSRDFDVEAPYGAGAGIVCC